MKDFLGKKIKRGEKKKEVFKKVQKTSDSSRVPSCAVCCPS